jgi:hypothetical protein
MNLRLPEKLRKMIEIEAKKNGWSLNRELVRRLEKSFVDQLTEQIIESTALRLSKEVLEGQLTMMNAMISEFNDINRTLGRSSVLDIKPIKGETNNG